MEIDWCLACAVGLPSNSTVADSNEAHFEKEAQEDNAVAVFGVFIERGWRDVRNDELGSFDGHSDTAEHIGTGKCWTIAYKVV